MTAQPIESQEALLIAYLSGGDVSRATLLQAIAQVRRENPGWLELKCAQMEAAFRISPCHLFMEFLDEYLTAGEKAPVTYPDAELHLSDCENCRAILAHAREFAYLDAPEAFAKLQASLRSEEQAILVLEPDGWSIWDDFKRLGNWIADREQKLSDWILPPQPAPAMGFASTSLEPLHLRLALPSEIGKEIILDILPPETGDVHDSWNWIFRDMPDSGAILTVQIFREESGNSREVTGKRNLESGVPVEFSLAMPSTLSLYHAVFTWQSADGELDLYTAAIPVSRLDS